GAGPPRAPGPPGARRLGLGARPGIEGDCPGGPPRRFGASSRPRPGPRSGGPRSTAVLPATWRPSWACRSAPSTSPAAGSWPACGFASGNGVMRHRRSSARSIMVARLNACDPNRLRLLVEDRLPTAEMTGLEDHLQHCAGCRQTLDGLVGGPSWLEAVRRYLGAGSTESDPAGPLGDGDAGGSLGFLAPTDWPDSLGRLGPYEVKGVI